MNSSRSVTKVRRVIILDEAAGTTVLFETESGSVEFGLHSPLRYATDGSDVAIDKAPFPNDAPWWIE